MAFDPKTFKLHLYPHIEAALNKAIEVPIKIRFETDEEVTGFRLLCYRYIRGYKEQAPTWEIAKEDSSIPQKYELLILRQARDKEGPYVWIGDIYEAPVKILRIEEA